MAAEASTGLISLFTGHLSVPPILGIGMAVDLAILIAGLISYLVIFKRGGSAMHLEELAQAVDSARIPPTPPPWHEAEQYQ